MSSSQKRLRCKGVEGEETQASIWLPDEIMYLIIVKVMVLPAYLARFSAVCKRWHRLVCDAWPKLVQEHQITSLVPFPVCRMFNLMGKCVVGECVAAAPVSSLPSGSTRIIGSSFEWLILSDDTNKSVCLFNPLSKSRIRLPSLLPLSSAYPLLVKGVLSKPPPPRWPKEEGEQGGGHLDIAITMGPGSWNTTAIRIAFLHVENIGKLESESESLQWVYKDMFGDEILDVNNIGGRIFILHCIGYFSCCTDICIRYEGVRMTWPLTAFDGDLADVYFLESSSSSKPLLVLRYKLLHRTVGFKVLTFTANDEGEDFNKATWRSCCTDWPSRIRLMNWTEVKTLGNDVIFLGVDNTNSICIQAAGSEHAAGSIYFNEYYYPPHFHVFNVHQNRFITHCDNSVLATKLLQTLPTIWFRPSYSYYDEILKFSSLS